MYLAKLSRNHVWNMWYIKAQCTLCDEVLVPWLALIAAAEYLVPLESWTFPIFVVRKSNKADLLERR